MKLYFGQDNKTYIYHLILTYSIVKLVKGKVYWCIFICQKTSKEFKEMV